METLSSEEEEPAQKIQVKVKGRKKSTQKEVATTPETVRSRKTFVERNDGRIDCDGTTVYSECC